MKGTESKKLESSFLAVCIAGGVGTIIYLALNKMGLTDFFGSKKPLDKESLAKEILKKETLVNEQLKQEILVNENLKKEILNKPNFFKEVIKDELSQNLEIAEKISKKYTNLISSLQKSITALELLIKGKETENQKLLYELMAIKMAFSLSSNDYENWLKKEQDLIREKSLLESKIENLTPSEKTSWVKADIEQSRKRLLECNDQLNRIARELRIENVVRGSVKNDLDTKENMINYNKSQCVLYKDKIALEKAELNRVAKQLAMNKIKIQELKSKLQEE